MSDHRPIRKAVSKGTRFEVFKRDGFTCQYCGAHPPAVVLHVDHINPVAQGGGNEIDNLITACSGCNLGKSATPLTVVPKSLQDRAEEVREREEQLAGYAAVMEAARERLEDDAWEAVAYMHGDLPESINRQQFESIRRFVDKLGLHQVMDAADITKQRFGLHLTRHNRFRDDDFRYFCGVCWKKIRGATGS